MASKTECPQCGGPLIPASTFTPQEVMRANVESGANTASAQTKMQIILDKIKEFGLPFLCLACRYITRLKGAA